MAPMRQYGGGCGDGRCRPPLRSCARRSPVLRPVLPAPSPASSPPPVPSAASCSVGWADASGRIHAGRRARAGRRHDGRRCTARRSVGSPPVGARAARPSVDGSAAVAAAATAVCCCLRLRLLRLARSRADRPPLSRALLAACSPWYAAIGARGALPAPRDALAVRRTVAGTTRRCATRHAIPTRRKGRMRSEDGERRIRDRRAVCVPLRRTTGAGAIIGPTTIQRPTLPQLQPWPTEQPCRRPEHGPRRYRSCGRAPRPRTTRGHSIAAVRRRAGRRAAATARTGRIGAVHERADGAVRNRRKHHGHRHHQLHHLQ